MTVTYAERVRAPALEQVMHATGTVPVAVVGAGQQATAYLIPALLHLPRVALVAVCDIDGDRAAAVAARFSIPVVFDQVTDLLNAMKVAALVVACPPQAHEEIAACALAHGVPVFVEKPPAVDLARLRVLAAAAVQAGVPTGVGRNFRYANPYLRVKELLADPECGRPVAVTIRHLASKPRAGLWGLPLLRSFLLAQAIHPVDLALDLGGAVTDARALRRVGDCGVLVGAHLEFAGGAVGSLLCGTHAPRFDTGVEVVTDAGVMVSLAGLSELTVAGLPAAKPARAEQLAADALRLARAELGHGTTPLPGAADLVGDLRGRRPLGIASNAARHHLLGLLEDAGPADAFEMIVGGGVAQPKPAPDLYLHACRQLHADPATAVAIEDSPAGARSARTAGLYVIAIPTAPQAGLDADLHATSLTATNLRTALRLPPTPQ